MVRGRFAVNGQADKSQTCNGGKLGASDGSDKRDALAGCRKLVALFFLFIVLMAFRLNVYDVATVAGHSMDDFLLQGDTLIVRKFDIKEIRRYDVVVAKVGRQKVIKRVIGLPGDVLQITDGVVYVDGKAVVGEYAFSTDFEGVARQPLTLSSDEYFLLGDNRSGSYDSRDFGAVKANQIIGVAVRRILPLCRASEI